jgi:hypothetical protein
MVVHLTLLFVFASGLKLQLPDISQPRPNLAVFQVTAAVPADFDLVFISQPEQQPEARLGSLTGRWQQSN